MSNEINYITGFLNHHQTEAEQNALPKSQNSPQKPVLGLYAEQLSGSAFTCPRALNLHSWLYRIQPSVVHKPFKKLEKKLQVFTENNYSTEINPNQMRWDPLPYPTETEPCNFIESITTFARNKGAAIHLYSTNRSMQNSFFYNTDGELLIIPESGNLIFLTEMGKLNVTPGEIIVIPRGVNSALIDKNTARGYILENFNAPLKLPELGPIGANGLANPRDFLYPVAHYFDKKDNFMIINKFQNYLFVADVMYNPLDVVAWHGNYAPYKYDLRKFNTINTVSFDHPDPSIFTVLTSQTNTPGVANVDFVIFPARWMVAKDTFRPPYYHRNIMSEYMGLIYGEYDAKINGFQPGGSSLHNAMTAHGPDYDAFNNASNTQLKPEYLDNTLAFMLESNKIWQLSNFALNTKLLQKDYYKCWEKIPRNFKI